MQQRGESSYLFAFHGTDYPALPLKAYDYHTQPRHEAETLGFAISTHPLTLYKARLERLRYIQAKEMKKHIGRDVTMAVWCITSRTVVTTHTANALPLYIHLDHSSSQIPPFEDYLYKDPDYPVNAPVY